MKKKLYLACMIAVLSTTSNFVNAETNKPKKELTTEQNERITQLTQRVEEIKKLDKSKLSVEEQQNLKTELTAIKKEAKAAGNGGIYLSVTALLVIIIILLIL